MLDNSFDFFLFFFFNLIAIIFNILGNSTIRRSLNSHTCTLDDKKKSIYQSVKVINIAKILSIGLEFSEHVWPEISGRMAENWRYKKYIRYTFMCVCVKKIDTFESVYEVEVSHWSATVTAKQKWWANLRIQRIRSCKLARLIVCQFFQQNREYYIHIEKWRKIHDK